MNERRYSVTLACLLGSACLLLALGVMRDQSDLDQSQPDPSSISESPTAVGQRADRRDHLSRGYSQSPPTPERYYSLALGNSSHLLNSDTSQSIIEFAQTGDLVALRRLSRESITDFVDEVTRDKSSSEIASFLESRFRIPPSVTLSKEKPESALIELIDAAVGASEVYSTGASVVITDRCESDGSITGSRHVVPAWSRRIYAVFENHGSLAGLSHVFAVWKDIHNDQVLLMESEPLRESAAYNFVWLDRPSGWPPGNYQLDLCHPERTSEALVRRTFTVK